MKSVPKKRRAAKKSSFLTCGNCDGGLLAEYDENGVTLNCPECGVRGAGPFEAAGEIPNYVPFEAPRNVIAWNGVFISTFRMNVDQGMERQDAIDSARQNASDTVQLTADQRPLVKDDPKLYVD